MSLSLFVETDFCQEYFAAVKAQLSPQELVFVSLPIPRDRFRLSRLIDFENSRAELTREYSALLIPARKNSEFKRVNRGYCDKPFEMGLRTLKSLGVVSPPRRVRVEESQPVAPRVRLRRVKFQTENNSTTVD